MSFLKKELTNDDMKFVILRGQDNSYGQTLKKGLDDWIKENKYNSILFICLGEIWEHIERKDYQLKLQKLMKENGYEDYKFCFSPYEDRTLCVKTRFHLTF